MFSSDPAWTPAQYRRIEKRVDDFSNETSDAALAEVVQCGIRHAFRNTRNKFTISGHKTVRIEGVDIDVGLADLIKEIWAAGIQTSMSCEDNVPANYCWIEFTDQNELNRFLSAVINNIVVDDNIVRLASRMQGLTNEFELQWLYMYNPIFDSQTQKMTTNVGVRFPHCDIDRVLRCLKNHNKALPLAATATTTSSKKRKQQSK